MARWWLNNEQLNNATEAEVTRNLPGVKTMKTVSVRVKIRTEHLPTASIKRYRYISLLVVNRILQRTDSIFRFVG
jgi:hypothetical protein